MDATPQEKLIQLKAVPALPWLPDRPDGSKVHLSTVYAWAKNGRRGAKLKTVWACGGLCTTEKWLMEFFEGRPAQSEPSPRTSAQRKAALSRVNRALDAVGI